MAKNADLLKKRVHELLGRLGLSQVDLAKRMSVSPQTLSAMLAKGNPQLDTIAALAAALGVTPAQILAGPEERALLESRLGTGAPTQWQQNVSSEILKRLEALETKVGRHGIPSSDARERVIARLEALPPELVDTVDEVLEAVQKMLSEGQTPEEVLRKLGGD